jgi:uncharacterized 2Fe-2S/4Fe-4S cluster protein (DUF4445 family)
MKIILKDSGLEADLVKGKTILSYLQELGIDIDAACGGEGKCGQCLVEVDSPPGALSERTEAEGKFLHNDSDRLACQATIVKTDKPIYVHIPRRSYCVLETGEFWKIPIEPFVHREGGRVFSDSEDVGEYTGKLCGIALDIGTTTLVMYLVDLETGAVLSVISRENPQTKYGNNVISRIEFARTGRELLEREIRIAVNELICDLIRPREVSDIVVVGNTVMRDLFFGYPVESLGVSPYEPLSVTATHKNAKELKLVVPPTVTIHGLPLIGSFIGADALAAVLATAMYQREKISMMIDIGTNTEIVLGNKDRLIATSCAAGPAFEGCSVRYGIGSVSGAINEVKLEHGEVRLKTIHHAKPKGICGSGLIDALAELLENRIINGRGKFYGDKKEFEVAEGISLSEKDIDQLNLAKSAVAIGIKVLMERYGIELDAIDRIFLAGGFGYFTNVENAMRIGLLPRIDHKKVDKVGNAAVEGARQALVSKTKRHDAEAVAKRIEHIKLEDLENFHEQFIGELYFKSYL